MQPSKKRALPWIAAALGVFVYHDATARIVLPEVTDTVGYARVDLLTDQLDNLTPAPDDRRTLMLEIWYPAKRGGRVKAWATEKMGAALSRQFPFPEDFRSEVRANALAGARAADGRFPVVVFSPGLSFPVTLYQSFTEYLASRGYVVVAVNHPHGVSHIDYADGSTLNMALWPEFEDETDRQRFLAEHASVWEQDLINVLDAMEGWKHPSPGNPVAGRLDLTRIGVVGHSYGGTAAGRLTRDTRVDAAIALEGRVRDPANEKSRGALNVGAPFLHIIGGYNRLEMDVRDYRPSPGAPVYRAIINGAGHSHLSDLIFVYFSYGDANWHSRHRYELSPGRILQISHDYLGAFLDLYLKGENETPLLRPRGLRDRLDGPVSGGYPEVVLTVDLIPPSL